MAAVSEDKRDGYPHTLCITVPELSATIPAGAKASVFKL